MMENNPQSMNPPKISQVVEESEMAETLGKESGYYGNIDYKRSLPLHHITRMS
jgi:hypothetical protein